jgi:hypothetical protein
MNAYVFLPTPPLPVLNRVASSQISPGVTSNQTIVSNRKLAGDQIARVDSPLRRNLK